MARHTRKRKFRLDTAKRWIPKTTNAAKKAGSSTVKRVRFLLSSLKSRAKKMTCTLDRGMSRAIRSITRKRK